MSHGSRIFALGILILVGSNYYPHQAWCMDCLVLKSQNMYVRYAFLPSNKEVLFPSGRSWRAPNPLKLVHTNICSPFDPISVRGNKYFISFTNDFSRKLWFNLSKKNLQLSLYSKVSRHMLKWKVVIKSKYLDLTEVVSTPQMNFKIIARKMALSNSLQLHTHHSKMALQRGKIGRSLI